MIHSVILPTETRLALDETVGVLINCCEVLGEIAGGTLTKVDIKAFFDTKYVSTDRAAWLARWLVKNDLPWSLSHEVKNWLGDAITDMRSLLAKDRTIVPRPLGDKPFLKARDQRPAWANQFHDFFVGLYGSMRSQPGGLNRHLCGMPRKFTGQKFYDNFRKANPRLRMCPICETDTVTQKFPDEKYKGQIDHYFPKSQFPHLALHAHNLLPICRTCNEERGSKPPTVTTGWKSVWLPYDEAIMNSHCFHSGSSAGPQLHNFVGTASSPDAIATLEKCYKIPARWREAMMPTEEEIFARLKDYFADQYPQPLNALAKALEVLLHDTIDLDFGYQPLAFVRAGVINKLLRAEVMPAISSGASSCPLADNLPAKRPTLHLDNDALRRLYEGVTY